MPPTSVVSPSSWASPGSRSGFSGGGPFALASAALLPELVVGAAIFASFAPYGSPGLDFCGDWPDSMRREVALFFTDRPRARSAWRTDSERLLSDLGTPEGWMTRWGQAANTDEAHNWEVARHLAPSNTTASPTATTATGTTGPPSSPPGASPPPRSTSPPTYGTAPATARFLSPTGFGWPLMFPASSRTSRRPRTTAISSLLTGRRLMGG